MGDDEITASVQAAQAGDHEAFSWLMTRHQGLVFGVCYRLTGNVHDAEDLAHESFIEAHVKLHTLREPTKFTPWLRTLTLNLCRMWYRRHRRDPVELREDLPPTPAEPPPDESEHARMLCGLSRLSVPHRLALVLHYLEGLSYEEVAAFLDVPVGTVMSRLHRARQGLRREVHALPDNEETSMIDENEFHREVDAEIALLAEMFPGEPTARERLSVILERSPQRLRGLVEHPGSDATLENVASLLSRLGVPAMDIVLDACVGTDPWIQANARRILQRFVSQSRSECRGVGVDARVGVGLGDMPSFDVCLLLDRLLQHPPAPPVLVELLVALMDAAEDLPTGQLLSEMVLCAPEPALALLLERFWATPEPEDVYRRGNWTVRTLRNTGTRFLRELTSELQRDDPPPRTALALAGVDALAVGVCDYLQRGDCPSVPGARFLNETADPARVALVQLDPHAIEAAIEQAARRVTHPDASLRQTAIRVLERLNARARTPALRACLAHPDLPTRVRAIHALAELGDHESEDALMTQARSTDAAERRAAIEALGRLHAAAARGLCVALAQDPDAQVRKAAVIALGELGRAEAHEPLLRLLASPDKVVRKAAASALYGMDRAAAAKRSAPPRRPGPRYGGEGVAPGTTRRAHFISPDAAIRVLQELRTYTEREITERIALVCGDWSTTRRLLVEHRLLCRADGVYEFTDLGAAVWRVEHFIMAHYLAAT